METIGDPLGIHDPSEAELGGGGPDSDGRFAKRSRKVIRGFFLMIIVTMCWVATIHLIRMSFDTQRVVVAIQPNSVSSFGMNHSISNRRRVRQIFNESISLDVPKKDNSKLESNFKPNQMNNNNSLKPKKNKLSNDNEIPRSKFDAPYFVTWFVTIWNILYLPVYLLIHFGFLRTHTKTGSESVSASVGSSAVSNNGPFGSSVSTDKNSSLKDGSNTENSGASTTSMRKVFAESVQGLMDRGFTTMQFMSRCAFFCALCLLANYMLFFSLRILDATVVMALFSCTTSIVYLLSWVVLHQQFVGIRIVAIIITDTGIALLVYMDGVQDRTLATVMIVFGSAIAAGVYKVFMRRMIGFTTFSQMALFHTIIGLLNTLLAWPLVLLLYWTGVETIVWSAIPWGYLTGAAACAFLANIIASFGVICTYEAFLTLGMFFAIVISAVIDININSVIFRDMKLGGILLICAGFLVVLLPDNWNSYMTGIFRKRLANWKKREEMKKSVGRVQDTATGQLSRLRTSSGRVK
ncbi:hypothetical protein RDWZM_000164 [Blomia tropicalis]|uniref:Solute carrier family 35 member F4 n=1 Tax=Blomia tropicalis TaxID=40697 RepID=A0A9Q0RPA9_BLOTA|nr:hypothetical protein RDWZM_000164 [Blomia tropicalis]